MRRDSDTLPVLDSLLKAANDVISVGDFRPFHRRECLTLVRRVKLLLPFFEEIYESQVPLSESVSAIFSSFETALQEAKLLLLFCRDGSKLYMALESEAILNKFHSVTGDMETALDGLPWTLFQISDEVREQVELVHGQLKRAKGRADTQDMELFVDVMLVVSNKDDRIGDPTVLQRLADKMQLRTILELKAEARALQRLIKERGSEVDESLEQMLVILRRLKGLAGPESLEAETLDFEKLSSCVPSSVEKGDFLVVPNDFKCPISLELMKDPVIVATGQTYERSSIQRWLEGHRTCPKTRQVLPHTVLTPNYVLRSLIAQWREENGVEPPNGPCPSGGCKPDGVDILPGDRAAVDVLVQRLSSGQADLQRAAAFELRLLAKRNAENRVCIAEAGAIPYLVSLLSTQDSRTQEHAVTALLNLSIHDCNKGTIVQAGAISPIVGVLRNGSMEARENAAATFFSLSVVDENKVTIGTSGAIPALVELLKDGTPRGRKDVATVLFNLSITKGTNQRL